MRRRSAVPPPGRARPLRHPPRPPLAPCRHRRRARRSPNRSRARPDRRTNRRAASSRAAEIPVPHSIASSTTEEIAFNIAFINPPQTLKADRRAQRQLGRIVSSHSYETSASRCFKAQFCRRPDADMRASTMTPARCLSSKHSAKKGIAHLFRSVA